MATIIKPNLVTAGLVFCADAGNPRSYDSRENLLKYSENFAQASYWDIYDTNSVVVSSNVALAPNNTVTADFLRNNNCSISLTRITDSFFSSSITNRNSLRCSVYAKQGTGTSFTLNAYYDGDTEVNVDFDLSTGTAAAGGSMENVGNGWYRCSITVPAAVSSTTDNIAWRIWPGQRAVTNTLGHYFWGAQMERSSSTGPYVSTTDTAILRGTHWSDLSGGLHHALLTSTGITAAVPRYNSTAGGCFDFDGVSSLITQFDFYNHTTSRGVLYWGGPPSASSNYNGATTQQVWILTTTSDATVRRIFADSNNNEGQLYLQDGAVKLYWGAGTGIQTLTSNVIDINTWYHLTSQHSLQGTSYVISLYINGEFVTSGGVAVSSTVSSYGPDTRLNMGYRFEGKLGHVAIYDRVLSADEIYNNYTAHRARFS